MTQTWQCGLRKAECAAVERLRLSPSAFRTPRSAFTLLEVLLTLAVLAIAAAFIWPSLDRPLAEQRLQKAADTLCAAWAGARVDAIESGQTCQFLYTPGGNRFRLELAVTTTDSQTNAAALDIDATLAAAGLSAPDLPHEELLPEGVVFQGDQQPTASSTTPAPIEDTPADTANWAEPLLFQPDGSSIDFRITLRNQYGSTLEVALRGFTGVATIGERRSAEEGL